MTNRFYQVQLGQDRPEQVTEAGSAAIGTGGVVVEVSVHYDATGMSKLQVLQSLQGILEYIARDTYPPV